MYLPKVRKLIFVFTVLMTACVQRPPKSIHVVPHVIKKVDTIEQYDPTTLNYKKRYRYEFWDSTAPVTVDAQHARYRVGDTIEYTYYQY